MGQLTVNLLLCKIYHQKLVKDYSQQVKALDRIREKRGEVRFSRGTAAAVREADRLAVDLRLGAVTREDLLNSGRAFATVDDWLKSMA